MLTATPPIDAGPSTAFRSPVQRILDVAAQQPDRAMISDIGQALTAGQFRDLVHALARRLVEHGVRADMLVALAAPVSIEAVAARYAAGLIGCATTLCPHLDEPDRLADYVRTVQADVLVCFPATRATAQSAMTQGAAPAMLCVEPLEPLEQEQLPDRAAFVERAVRPDQPGTLITSGGTTGGSKASRRSFAQWLAITDTGPAVSRRQLICSALAYVSQVHLDQALLGGGSVVLLDRFDPAQVLRVIESERITHLCLVEPLLVELADHPDARRRDLSSLVVLSHIGADAAPSLRRRLQSLLGPGLTHVYGASEAGLISVLSPAAYRLPGVELRIERIDGAEAGPDEDGMIVVRSPAVASGYVGSTAQSPFGEDGWYRTGDLGRIDQAGALQVRGRSRDERIVDGMSVLPVDVQQALCSHPDVRYAVAIPADDGADGFDAIVQLHPQATVTMAGLRASANGRPCAPRRIVAVGRLPVTEQGKPDRRAIGAILAAGSV